jgi:predicted lipoprotein with Yx(FWY)xxD motif
MQIRTPLTVLLALGSLLAPGCEASPNAPYAGEDDSYEAQNVQAADAGASRSGSAWTPSAGGGDSGAADAAAPLAPADVELHSAAGFDNYLADAQGRPLYLFANDLPGANASTCTGACLDKWPVFDAKDIQLGQGLNAADFGRFQRAEGTWQSTFKGRPLYRFAADPAGGGVTGDGMGGRWFVARDYFAFTAAKADLTPEGASAPAPYLTNRAGRTVYVFLSDTPGQAGAAPISACADKCLDAWPTWNAPASLDALALPSTMKATDFGVFERVAGGATVKQLSYRGWPLYFHTPDAAPGETSGHGMGAWRALDPVGFADANKSPGALRLR